MNLVYTMPFFYTLCITVFTPCVLLSELYMKLASLFLVVMLFCSFKCLQCRSAVMFSDVSQPAAVCGSKFLCSS